MIQEDLLTQADFIRSLARSLIADEHHAADVEQTTWVAALEHPPPADIPLRSWLARVIRNFSVSLYRRESRRRKHERILAEIADTEEEIVSTPDEITAHKEAIGSLTAAVLDLEEPYLTVILLRYFKGLPVRGIADRLGVSHQTVKTRLRRGLNRLRETLDVKHDGDRSKWILVLAPVAGLKLASPAAAAALAAQSASAAARSAAGAQAAAGLSGGGKTAAVPAVVKLCSAVAIVLVTLVGLVLVLPERDEGDEPDPMSVLADPHDAGPASSRTDGAPLSADRNDTLDERRSAAAREPLAPTVPFVSGRVTDEETGAPVEAFDFRMWRHEPEGPRMVHHETVRDREGLFSIPVEEGSGTYNLAFCGSRYRLKAIQEVEIGSAPGPIDLQVALDPGSSITGRVVEDDTNEPIEGAIVGLAGYPWETDLASLVLLGFDEMCIHARTGPDGRFTLSGLSGTDRRIVAAHPDFAERCVGIAPGSGGDVEIRLNEGFRLFGIALDDMGEPASGLLIRLYGDGIGAALPVTTNADGSFTTPPVRPGRVIVKAGDPHLGFETNPDFTEELRIVTVVDSDEEIDFGPSPEHVAWRGALLGFDGRKISGGLVMIGPAGFSTRDSHLLNLRRRVRCDDEGRFEAGRLLPGRYRIDLSLPGRTGFEWGIVTLDTAGLAEKNIDLSLDSLIAGTVVSKSTGRPVTVGTGQIWAWQEGGAQRRYSGFVDAAGGFEIEGVRPGIYHLQGNIDGRYSDRVVGVNATGGEANRDVLVELETVGGLRVRLDGFTSGTREPFSLALLDTGLAERTEFGTLRIREAGNLEMNFSLEAGSWIISLAFPDLGYVERRLDVLPEERTDITIFRSEIALHEGDLPVSGGLVREDGSPLGGRILLIEADSVPGLPPGEHRHHARTGPEGKFVVEGLRPGRWKVSTVTTPGTTVIFPQLWIHPDPPCPFPVELVLPGGTVTGSVSDRATGLPFSAGNPDRWKVTLLEVDKEEHTGTFAGGDRDDVFRVDGVAAGKYQLLIDAEGYGHYRSGTFPIREGQKLDVGEVFLDPCGILDLQVVDAASQPVAEYGVACDDGTIDAARAFDGKRRYDKLPIGEIVVTVRAEGYQDQPVRIRTEPSRAVTRRVVMIPE